jgi:hypothetical protein
VHKAENWLMTDHGAFRVTGGAWCVAEHVVCLWGGLVQLDIWVLVAYIDDILELVGFKTEFFSLFAAFLINIIEADDVSNFLNSTFLLLLEDSSQESFLAANGW